MRAAALGRCWEGSTGPEAASSQTGQSPRHGSGVWTENTAKDNTRAGTSNARDTAADAAYKKGRRRDPETKQGRAISASRTVPSLDATRIMLWVVSFSILTEMLRAGVPRVRQGDLGPREHGLLLQVVQGLQAVPESSWICREARGFQM